eukprot:TRINITY_DN7232_c1_g2_i1.p1 TRINITY_DN7232_c1_g2~~TRINITY_DN7232_c1_g2_i1.p1  ORF type:complete len:697 (-),score=160.58 TRINITY_DN7232_c1_g2_i1:132-2222(-)
MTAGGGAGASAGSGGGGGLLAPPSGGGGVGPAGTPPSTGPSDSSSDAVEGRLLDGFLLLAAGGSLSPDDAITVNLSSLNLVDVAVEDLGFFTNLDRLDASDNQLSYEQILAQMGRLPRLTSLNLACNSISSLQAPSGSLRTLQFLDLSFNGLHGDVLIQLAHVPNLVTLILTANCISSVPPEEDLYGLQNLEELVLDQNDLVQFVQWRALDALPRLRKLSLASNRVKRLRDDAPDRAAGSGPPSYFPLLVELDLSNNEIASMDCLPVVQVFRSLRTLTLSDNPCSHELAKEKRQLRGAAVVSEETKPWYLRGSGCFQAKRESRRGGPRINLDRGRLRRVKSQPQVAKGARGLQLKADTQVGVYDEEANQLFVTLGGAALGYPGGASAPGAGTDAERTQSASVVVAATSGGGAVGSPAAMDVTEGILGDDISEQELRRIFKQRRETIEERFSVEVEEPASFMRPAPFAIRAALDRKLARASQQEEEEAGGVHHGGGTGCGGGRSQSSLAFLTSVGEDSEVAGVSGAGFSRFTPSASTAVGERRALGRKIRSSRSDLTVLPSGGIAVAGDGTHQQAEGTTLDLSCSSDVSAGDASALSALAAVQGIGTPTSPSLILPPIREGGSREASGFGSTGGGFGSTVSLRLAAASAQDVTDFNVSMPRGAAFAPGKQRPMADLGVREAMRALRAAAMSEHVAAT